MSKGISREASAFVSCSVSGTTYTLYTCPANCTARVPLVFITNVGGTATVSFQIYKASLVDTFHIIGGKNMTAAEYIQLSDPTGMIIETGDRLEIVATGGTVHVDALCTVIETFKPVG